MTQHTGQPQSLDGLFQPKSIAVIGASNSPVKWGNWIAAAALGSAHRRTITLVNPRGETVLGQPTVRSIRDMASPPDVAFVCVPKSLAAEAIIEAANAGVRYVVCITAGFAEAGEAGARLQADLVASLTDTSARLVGPNCAGIFDAAAELHCVPFVDIPPGAIGVVSQSGSVILELAKLFAETGMGVSRAVSIGNQADLGIADYLDDLALDDNTRTALLYVEDLKDARKVFAAVDRLVARGKPVVVLSAGDSPAARRAAQSHTASLTSNDALLNAACRDSGAIRVRSLHEAALVLKTLASPCPPKGRRVAVVADGGGGAVLGVDAMSRAGMVVNAFSDTLQQAIAPLLGAGSGISNPIDAVGASSVRSILPALGEIIRSGEADIVVLAGILTNVDETATDAYEAESTSTLLDMAQESGVHVAAATLFTDAPFMRALSAAKAPVFSFAAEAAQALALATAPLAHRRRPAPQLPRIPAKAHLPANGDYFGARSFAESYGIAFGQARPVRTLADALTTAEELGYPVVLKALVSLHKSDLDAVAINLSGPSDLEAAFQDMAARLSPEVFSLEAMIPSKNGVELIVGGTREPGFGPTIMVGIGGTITEVLRDTVVAQAPVNHADALAMLDRLSLAPLLRGYRGKPAVSLDKLADAIVAMSHLLAENSQVLEAEVNPLIVTPEHATAVDARIIIEAG